MFQNGLCSFFLKNILLTKKKKSICDRIVNEVTSMYYFIGIKGSGMAPLATILYELGNEVAGSDIDKYIFIEDELRKRNIPIYSFNKDNIKDGYHVIIGNAFDESNEEVKAALENPNVKCTRYYDFLADFMEHYVSIAVAGTHGKTTTTGMAYHLFEDFDKTSVLIGDGTGHGQVGSKYFISETCEFQDHFLHYHPDYAIINNIELDHVDYFGNLERYIQSFEQFAKQVKKTVIVWGDDPNIKKIHFEKHVLRFGLGENNDVRAVNVLETPQGLSFDVYIHQELFGHFNIPLFGMHMLYNSLAIITLGYLEDMSYDYILSKLQTFKGTKRRYTVKTQGNNVFVDDYAHHPTAIRYVIEATRVRYPGKKIVFQGERVLLKNLLKKWIKRITHISVHSQKMQNMKTVLILISMIFQKIVHVLKSLLKMKQVLKN